MMFLDEENHKMKDTLNEEQKEKNGAKSIFRSSRDIRVSQLSLVSWLSRM